MATEIVGSLFGVTPEMFQQRQAEMADRQALDYAQLSPLQRASYGLARGGYQLAGALGGQDPQLQIISRRQAIARQIDPTDLNSMQMGVQALAQAGDQVGAMQLAQVLRQAENDIALRSQRQAAAMASTAQAGKTEQEMAEIKRQQEVYRRFKEGQQVETPAPAAMTAANVPVTAVAPEITAPKAIFNQDAIAGINPEAQKNINIILDDAAQARARAEEFKGSARASGFLNQAVQLETQAASMLAVQKRRGKPFDTGAPATNEEVNAALQELAVGQTRTTEPTAPAAVAPAAAAPVSQAPSDIAAQLRALETRYDFLKSLSKVPDAQNEAAGLERRMAVLRDQLKPADVGQEREALSLQDYNKRYSQLTTAERETVNKKIADAKTQSFGADRESVALELYDKPFLQLTTAQRAIVNKRVEDEQGKRATKIIMPGERVESKDWLKFEEFIEKQPTFKQTASIVSSAPGVLRTIRQSTSNDFAAAALPASIAKLFDQGTLSNQDITRYASTGGLDDRLALAATRFFTGKVTSVAKAEAERFMSAIYRGALLDQRNMYVKQAQRLGYADSPNYKTTLQQIDEELAKFRPSQPAGTPAATAPAAGTPTAPRAGTTGNALVDKYLTPQ